jgi:3-oxoacyl-[acyl-carrier protein] reductase
MKIGRKLALNWFWSGEKISKVLSKREKALIILLLLLTILYTYYTWILSPLLRKISDEEWRQIIDSNLGSAFYCSRWALKNMLRRRYGRIINISSVVGLGGNAGQAHYAAAKSGLMGLTCSIAKEYGRRGVTANLVAPGYIQTDMTAALNDSQKSRIAEGIALGRLGTPADVAGVVAFLASPRADYINGTVIRVDGGLSSI